MTIKYFRVLKLHQTIFKDYIMLKLKLFKIVGLELRLFLLHLIEHYSIIEWP